MLKPSSLLTFVVLYALLYAGFGMQSPFVAALLRDGGFQAQDLGFVLAAAMVVRVIAGPMASLTPIILWTAAVSTTTSAALLACGQPLKWIRGQLEYGKSLVEHRLLHAREVSYVQTRELQIVCPACGEPLHKRGSAITTRQYFAHYSAKPGADCDLRVFSMMRAAAQLVAFPKGQELLKFLARFEEIVLEQSNYFGNGHALLNQMRNRSAYRTMLFRNREVFRSRVLNSNLIDLMIHEELQGAVRDVMLFLTSANSFRALIFAASFGMMVLHAAAERPGDFRFVAVPALENLRQMRSTTTSPLIGSSDATLRCWLHALNKEEQESVGLDILHALIETACHFVHAVKECHLRPIEA